MVAAVFTSQGVGLLATIVILLASGEIGPTQESVVWGAFAGISGACGLGCLYLALARGMMGVVAPLAALIGAGVPVLIAIAGGESAPLGRLAGMAVALFAVVLITWPARAKGQSARHSLRSELSQFPLILLSGLGFAGAFIGLDRASEGEAIWWPLLVVRVCGFGVVVVAFAALVARLPGESIGARVTQVLGIDRFRESGRSVRSILPLLLLTGLGDLFGNIFFILALNTDALSVAVVLSSLYPVVTTVLAAVLLRERLRPAQLAGVALATASVPLLR